MTKTLALRSLTPDVWQMIQNIAPAMHQSRLFGLTAPEQAAAIMLKGYELGLGLTASFDFIHVISGRPTLSPRGALALIHQSGVLEEIKVEDTDKACRVYMKRENGFEYDVEFTLEDAKTAGLVKKDSGWEKYPRNMLRWRAIGFCADVVFPDVIGGMKRADELGASITADGDINVIETEWTAAEPSYSTKLDELLAQYEADDVFAANDGQIPTTDEEVEAVLIKLQENEGIGDD